MENDNSRRDFLKKSLSLLVVSAAGGTTLYGRIFPKSFKEENGIIVGATYTLKVSDYPTETLPPDDIIKTGLAEVGSSIKLLDPQELLMNPDHCERNGRDGKKYPIAVVRVKESGEDAFTAVSTWCPHNNKSQLDYFDASLGESGLFVCSAHEFSSYKADGTWVPPNQSPYPDAPDKDEFFFNLNEDGTPHLTRFRVTFDGDDTITIHDILCECAPCVVAVAPDDATGDYNLEQNYPNPVRHSTIFKFSLPEAARVTLTVLAEDGEEVAIILQQKMEAGVHNVDFKAKDLPSGSYFYKLESRFGTKTRRMTVVK